MSTARHPTPRAGFVEGDGQLNISRYPTRRILQRVVWKEWIPTYFFLGGLAGASAVLAAASDIAGWSLLARRLRVVALAAVALCPPPLILDLGRPERFLNMLRVFRPTSPMSVGTWILSAFGGAAGLSALSALTGRLTALGRLGELGAAALGAPLATYTAVLLGNTSVPVWHGGRRELPFLFATGAAASAAGLGVVLTPPAEAGPARRLAVATALGEIAIGELMRHRLGGLGGVYTAGPAAAYRRASAALMVTGAALLAFGGRRRPLAVAGGLCVLGGAATERFAVWRAGVESAERT